jgi:hypothetical protein
MRFFITIITSAVALFAFVLAEPSGRTHYIDKTCTNKETWASTYDKMQDLLKLTVKLLKSDSVPEDILGLVNRLFNIQWKVDGQTNPLWRTVIGMHQIAQFAGVALILLS